MDEEAKQFIEHWRWWVERNGTLCRDNAELDLAMAAAASAWSTAWKRGHPKHEP